MIAPCMFTNMGVSGLKMAELHARVASLSIAPEASVIDCGANAVSASSLDLAAIARQIGLPLGRLVILQ
jgi:hypothetical protein